MIRGEYGGSAQRGADFTLPLSTTERAVSGTEAASEEGKRGAMTRRRDGDTTGIAKHSRRADYRYRAICAFVVCVLTLFAMAVWALPGEASVNAAERAGSAQAESAMVSSAQTSSAQADSRQAGAQPTARPAADRATAQLPEPEHTKTIERLDDERYRLTLSVTGAESTSGGVDHKSADVVLVLDSSGSMAEHEDPDCHWPSTCLTRWQVVTQAAQRLAATLLDPSIGGNVRIALVDFDTNASIVPMNGSQWTGDAAALSTALEGLDASSSTGGGTNWEAGMHAANSLLNGSTADRRYIVMLSDGSPTFRTSAMGGDDWNNRYGVYGNGSSDPDGRCFDAAVAESNKRADGTALFTVSAGKAAETNMAALATAANGVHYSGTDPDSLADAFDDIAMIITSTIRYRDVSISDTLSSWVVALDDDGSPATGADAVVTPQISASKADGSAVSTDGMVAAFDQATGTLTLHMPDGKTLDPETTYRVSIDITPTASAYRSFIETGKYPDTGDELTDAPGNATSSGQPGFFSNAEGSALLRYKTVTLTVSGDSSEESVSDELTAAYARPVVQVAAPSLTLVKTVDNTHATAYTPAQPAAWNLSASLVSASAPQPGASSGDTASGSGISPAAPSEREDEHTAALPAKTVEPGTYRLAEAHNDDYTVDGKPYQNYARYESGSWACADAAGNPLSVSSEGDVAIAPGMHATCTIVNTASLALADQIPLTGVSGIHLDRPWLTFAVGLPLAGTGVWILKRSRRRVAERNVR